MVIDELLLQFQDVRDRVGQLKYTTNILLVDGDGSFERHHGRGLWPSLAAWVLMHYSLRKGLLARLTSPPFGRSVGLGLELDSVLVVTSALQKNM